MNVQVVCKINQPYVNQLYDNKKAEQHIKRGLKNQKFTISADTKKPLCISN